MEPQELLQNKQQLKKCIECGRKYKGFNFLCYCGGELITNN